eukprot:11161572-Lingulodinium_polyedra.AAC.1
MAAIRERCQKNALQKRSFKARLPGVQTQFVTASKRVGSNVVRNSSFENEVRSRFVAVSKRIH